MSDQVSENATEQQLRLVIDAAPSLLAYIDNQRRYRFNNRAYEEWFGQGRAQIFGKRMEEVLGDAAYANLRPYVEAALSGRKVAFESVVPYKDGGSRYVQATYVPDVGEGGQIRGFVALVNDVTERKRAEDALRASEERYRAFVQNSSEAIWRFELEEPVATDEPEDAQIDQFYGRGYLAECNDAMARMYGFAHAGDLVGARLGDLLVRSDAGNVEYLRAFIRSGYCLTDAPSREFDRDGNPRYFLNNLVGITGGGLLLRAWGTQRDVTEGKRAEEENARLLTASQGAAQRQRTFLRDVLASVTEGKLRLCAGREDLPAPLGPASEPMPLSRPSLRALRVRTVEVAIAQGFSAERWQDLETAVGEAGMNAVLHAGGGTAQVRAGASGAVQVWIEDRGAGIAVERLHRATLERGYTTAGSLGHGFWLMLRTCDRTWLLTGPSGTTVVLEQDRDAPQPDWLRGAL